MPATDPTVTGILGIYRGAVKNLPLLKYSWVVVAAICLLALTAYFKLNNSDVFLYALVLLFICLVSFVFSFMLKTRDKFIRFILHFFIAIIVFTMSAVLLSFASFIIFKKPDFFNRWFEKKEVSAVKGPDNPVIKPPIIDTNFKAATNILPITYNNSGKDSIALVFEVDTLHIRHELQVPRDIQASQLLENLVDHYKLANYIPQKTQLLHWQLIHEHNLVNMDMMNKKISELGWASKDEIAINGVLVTTMMMKHDSAEIGAHLSNFVVLTPGTKMEPAGMINEVTVSNKTKYAFDKVILAVDYLGPDGKVLRTELLDTVSVKSNSDLPIKLPAQKSGKNVRFRIVEANSPQLKLNRKFETKVAKVVKLQNFN